MLPSPPRIEESELRRILEYARRAQSFKTYDETLAALEALASANPELVRVHKEKLPSGRFLFHAEIGRRTATIHDALLADPHSEEFPGLTSSLRHAEYVLDDVKNGADRCLHIFGTNPDQAALQEPAIAMANTISGDPRLLGRSLRVAALSLRHPDPTLVTEWAGVGADGFAHPSTLGRLFLEERLRLLVQSGFAIRMWGSLHAGGTQRTHVMLDGERSRLRRYGRQLQAATDCQLQFGDVKAEKAMLLDGVPFDPEFENAVPLPGCHGVYPQLTSRSILQAKHDGVLVGAATPEFVLDLHPQAITYLSEVGQYRLLDPRSVVGFANGRSIEEIAGLVASRNGELVDYLYEGAISLAKELPDDDLVVQMVRASRTGPEKWGTPKKGSAGFLSASSRPADDLAAFEQFFGGIGFMMKFLAPARRMVHDYRKEVNRIDRDFADDFRQQFQGMQSYAGDHLFALVNADDVAAMQMFGAEVTAQLASGRELAPELIGAEMQQELAGFGTGLDDLGLGLGNALVK